MPDDLLYLFGGDQPWDSSLWTASDDRVRGGASTSYLSIQTPERAAFTGRLDTSTLGGAGFASQRTVGELDLDLSAYAGLLVAVVRGDGKTYAVTLKDALPGKRADGRDRASVSWEARFRVEEGGRRDVVLPWGKFRATYRGREVGDAEPLDLKSVKRVGLMMRSYFGKQEGDFEVQMHCIAAKKSFDEDEEEEEEEDLKKTVVVSKETPQRPWWKALLCGLC